MNQTEKLDRLADLEGYEDSTKLLETAIFDSVVPGICQNDGCDYTTGVEPDCDRGWCELCNKYTVESALVLADLI